MKNQIDITKHFFLNSVDSTPRNKLQSIKKDIVIFSHLRWEFVTQRPQHIATGLSKNHRIFFIEEPVKDPNNASPHFKTDKVKDTIYVIEPFSQLPTEEYDYASLMETLSERFSIQENPVMWFYSPMFVQNLKIDNSSLVVYDRMDKLSSFKDAPLSLNSNENFLISISDLIFTGGRSLYEDIRDRHPAVYCFPSSVDASHFQKAKETGTAIPSDINQISRPRVGFYGVIDERFDVDLVNKTAQLLPEISFIFIGPVVKIDPATLPKAANIHYLGMKTYSLLPSYLKAIDIAFIPFAMNEATKYISPTKTLEYMAASKPVISTPIHDIVHDYQKTVKIVASPLEAKRAIIEYLDETDIDKNIRIEKENAIVKKTSWSATVAMMEKLINSHLQNKYAPFQQYNTPFLSLDTFDY